VPDPRQRRPAGGAVLGLPQLDFKIPVYPECDCMARYLVRMDEMEQCLRIVEQAIAQLPEGPVMGKVPRVVKVPAGDYYHAVEAARGRFAIRIVSDGKEIPYRLKLRTPSFSNLSLFEEASRGMMLPDALALMGSLDLVIMVAGVGMGTQLAINGACAHAFAHILYKGLLFMGCGAVLHMTGRSKFSELGGLYRKMPWTFVFTLVGGLSISAFPLFSGFVSKSMIVAAGFEEHRLGVGYLLMLASVGTFLHTGLKVPYFIWFAEKRCSDETWQRASEPPWNMGVAMAVAPVLCIYIGCRPGWLYGMLPNPVEYQPYTSYHVSETLLVLLFTAVGFFLLIKKLAPEATISVDLDWFYRKGGQLFLRTVRGPLQSLDDRVGRFYRAGGLDSVRGTARGVAWFDGRVIDALVDGVGGMVRGVGGWLRGLQRGSIQESLLLALGAGALVLLGFVLLR